MKKLIFQESQEDRIYNIYLNDEFIGCIIRESESGLWKLEIPKYNIWKTGQYRHDLMEYAEIQINKVGDFNGIYQ